MKLKVLFSILLLYVSHILSAQQIVETEYFIDTDPGYGNGILIPINLDSNVEINNYSINVATLNKGYHTIGFRSKDSNGTWSITNLKKFYKDSAIVSPEIVAPIVKAEYFIDSDPGFGNAISLSITTDTNTILQSTLINLSTVNPGFHTIGFRSQDSMGKWSITNLKRFYKDSTLAILDKQFPIVKAEYFIDTDPGFGNASSLSISMDTNVILNYTTINLSSVSSGFHTLGFRTQDSLGKWSITNLKKIYKDSMLSIPNKRVPIVKAEYFIDTDPGFGMAFSLPIAIDTNSILQNSQINLSTVNPGFHTIGFRTQDSLGTWSITNLKKIYKDSTLSNVATLAPIVKVEYFIDLDPGFGNGINLPINADTQVVFSNYTLPLSIASSGFHQFVCRTQVADGKWSICNTMKIFVSTSKWFEDLDADGFGNVSQFIFSTSQPIGYVLDSTDCNDNDASLHALFPFYVDNDLDGIGAGNMVFVCAQNNVLAPIGYSLVNTDCNDNDSSVYNTTALYNDLDGDGFGDTTTMQFFCVGLPYTIPNGKVLNGDDCNDNNPNIYPGTIERAEYFFDHDPGFNNGISLSVFPNNTDSIHDSYSIIIPNTLSAGGHILNARVKTCKAAWSAFESSYLYVEDSITIDAPLVRAEYFIDNDPGEGNRDSILFIPSADTINAISSIPIPNALAKGIHEVYLRVQDSTGQWGTFESRIFYYIDKVYASPLVAAEYFIDNDPGIGNGVSISVGLASDTFSILSNITMPANLETGMHLLSIRVKDSLGDWSLFSSKMIHITASAISTPLVAAEYFIDNDPGVGNASSLNIGMAMDTMNILANISIPSNLPTGMHLLSIRVMDSIGKWSLFSSKMIHITASAISTPLVAAEYFIDNDPGVGNGIAISTAYVVDTLTTTENITLPSTISIGAHQLCIRVKDSVGTWSLMNATPFNVTGFLGIKLFIEGYYVGNNEMANVLLNQGEPSHILASDSIIISVMNEVSPGSWNSLFEKKVELKTNGEAYISFPASLHGNMYYLKINHRNTVETWTSTPILIDSLTQYNFSLSANQAFGNNQKEVAPGVFALYTGDINQDGFVDIFDFLDWDVDNQNFSFGYLPTDLNGDGFVDIFDFLIWDPNNQAFVGVIMP
ncbi:MAG: hypothetical protein R2831_02560 [Chitinophagaceae bacterium]